MSGLICKGALDKLALGPSVSGNLVSCSNMHYVNIRTEHLYRIERTGNNATPTLMSR